MSATTRLARNSKIPTLVACTILTLLIGAVAYATFTKPAPTKIRSETFEQYIDARPATTTTTTSPKPIAKAKQTTITSPPPKPVEAPQDGWVAQCSVWLYAAGIPETDHAKAIYLIDRESDCNPTAQNRNSTAFGIAQFLNSTWAGVGCIKTSDPIEQLRCMNKYVIGRYGSWAGAVDHSKNRGWY